MPVVSCRDAPPVLGQPKRRLMTFMRQSSGYGVLRVAVEGMTASTLRSVSQILRLSHPRDYVAAWAAVLARMS
jgi:hypothetical protein